MDGPLHCNIVEKKEARIQMYNLTSSRLLRDPAKGPVAYGSTANAVGISHHPHSTCRNLHTDKIITYRQNAQKGPRISCPSRKVHQRMLRNTTLIFDLQRFSLIFWNVQLRNERMQKNKEPKPSFCQWAPLVLLSSFK